jgi:hypothetical protein
MDDPYIPLRTMIWSLVIVVCAHDLDALGTRCMLRDIAVYSK